MPKKYTYRKQMGGLLDYHGFRTQTEEFLNDLDGDISAANAKIGNLSNLTTTDKSNLVAAINEAAQSGGGGGGSEEQFQKVYEATLTEASSVEGLTVTSENMGGVYIDVVVYIDIPASSGAKWLDFQFSDSSDEGIFYMGVPLSGTTTAHTSAAVMSIGGLEFASWAAYDLGLDSQFKGNLSIIVPQTSDIGGGVYPTEEKIGVTNFLAALNDGETAFPAGTTITVYARKPVTTPAE